MGNSSVNFVRRGYHPGTVGFFQGAGGAKDYMSLFLPDSHVLTPV